MYCVFIWGSFKQWDCVYWDCTCTVYLIGVHLNSGTVFTGTVHVLCIYLGFV